VLREGLRLGRWQRALFYGCFVLLFATGALWLTFHYGLEVEGEFGKTPHPLEHWWLQTHGAAAMLFLMVLGSLVRGHMRLGWKIRRNRGSGGTLIVTNVVLIFTGWALYYVGGESLRPQVSGVHSALGVLVPLLLGVHLVLGRRSAPAKASADRSRSEVGAVRYTEYLPGAPFGPAVGVPHRGPDPVQLQPANRVRAGRQQR